MSLNWKFWCKWRWSEIFYVDDDGGDDDDDESFMMIWFLKGFKSIWIFSMRHKIRWYLVSKIYFKYDICT